ncbi:MAG: hypothetical protein PHS92_05275 [Candidatus Gracilibacteria bacterium]|nr:hypothetical protein [Candidatus Gracilibacteria bacterium]
MRNIRSKIYRGFVLLLGIAFLSSSLAFADDIGRGDSNRNERIGRGQGGVRVLNQRDEDTLRRKIDSVFLNNRMNFINGIIGRVNGLLNSIQNGRNEPAIKARKIAFLQEILDVLNQKLAELQNIPGTPNTPPTLSSLGVSVTSSTTVMASVTSNEAGIGYYVVLPNGYGAPTAEQIKSGTNSGGNSMQMKGSVSLKSGINQFNISGLLSSTSYVLYFTAQDFSGNLQQNVASVIFQSGSIYGDSTPPQISGLGINVISNTAIRVTLNLNETGIGFYEVLPSGAGMPVASQVRLGLDSVGNGTLISGSMRMDSGINQFNISGLTTGVNYTFYFTAQDNSGNLQQSVSSISFQAGSVTGDTAPPTISSISTSGITAISANVTVSVNETGLGYYVVLPNGSGIPTAAQIKAGTDSNGNSVQLKGSVSLGVGSNQFSIIGLATNTGYVIYFTAQDNLLNLQPIVTGLWFTTTM